MGGNGSGGHNKKSIWQHIKDGTYRKDRHGPRPQPGAPSDTENAAFLLPKDISPPEWLSEEAQSNFRLYAPDLIEMGTLTSLNLRLFEGLCSVLAHMKEITIILNKEGYVLDGKPHPLLRVYNQFSAQSLGLMKDFGMTPLSRSKLQEGKQPDFANDPMAKFLHRNLN